jgi:hypothetical protein
MMYTRERLMKAVREAGRNGQPFTLGEVRGELGLKSRDKREIKRFRSRFRECSQILGDKLEQLGPNTFRLKSGYAVGTAPAAISAPVAVPAPKPAASAKPNKGALREIAKPVPVAQPEAATTSSSLLDRVAVATNPAIDEDDPYTTKRRARAAISFEMAQPSARKSSFGERLSSWFGRSRVETTGNTSAASTALSRLAVDLQPKAASFEYRWIDGKLQVQRAEK